MTMHRDVVVIGSGPAGLAVAAACARRGLSVGCIAPASGARWSSRYGMWADELDACDVPPVVAHRWDRVTVRLAERGPIELSRAYVWLDNDATRDRWLDALGPEGRIDAAVPADGVRLGGVPVDGARVDRVRVGEDRVDGDQVEITLDDGRTIRASVVIDAAGARSPWTTRETGPAPGWQSAWGVTGRVAGDLDPTELRLMDFSEPFDDGFGPGFLYALPLGGDRWFLEETSLVRPEPLPWDVLEARLDTRMQRLGLRWIGRDDEVERCRIPMGGPLPVDSDPVVPFGAAAGLVHPATGYSVALSMRIAGEVAAAIAKALPEGPGAARAAARRAVWPPDRVRAWRLFTFGMRALQTWDHAAINAHFAAFFAVESSAWSSWLAATATPRELRATMWSVFRRASGPARLRLVRAGLGPDAGLLASGLIGRGRRGGRGRMTGP